MRICEAIRARRELGLFYEGHHRIVEPHTFGTDRRGHKALLAYQVAGGSESGTHVGWKLFHADKIDDLTPLGGALLRTPRGLQA